MEMWQKKFFCHIFGQWLGRRFWVRVTTENENARPFYCSTQLTNCLILHMTDVCDFFEHEDPDADAESELALLARVTRFKAYLRHLGQWYPRILVVSHADFIWHLTSHVVTEGGTEGSRGEAAEKYGQWLGNGETCFLELAGRFD